MTCFKATRDRYDRARQLKEKQDAYCRQALSGHWSDLDEFPENLQWEALVDVLRGRVKVSHPVCLSIRLIPTRWVITQVQTHCYEAVDLDDLIRVRIVYAQGLAPLTLLPAL